MKNYLMQLFNLLKERILNSKIYLIQFNLSNLILPAIQYPLLNYFYDTKVSSDYIFTIVIFGFLSMLSELGQLTFATTTLNDNEVVSRRIPFVILQYLTRIFTFIIISVPAIFYFLSIENDMWFAGLIFGFSSVILSPWIYLATRRYRELMLVALIPKILGLTTFILLISSPLDILLLMNITNIIILFATIVLKILLWWKEIKTGFTIKDLDWQFSYKNTLGQIQASYKVLIIRLLSISTNLIIISIFEAKLGSEILYIILISERVGQAFASLLEVNWQTHITKIGENKVGVFISSGEYKNCYYDHFKSVLFIMLVYYILFPVISLLYQFESDYSFLYLLVFQKFVFLSLMTLNTHIILANNLFKKFIAIYIFYMFLVCMNYFLFIDISSIAIAFLFHFVLSFFLLVYSYRIIIPTK